MQMSNRKAWEIWREITLKFIDESNWQASISVKPCVKKQSAQWWRQTIDVKLWLHENMYIISLNSKGGECRIRSERSFLTVQHWNPAWARDSD